MIVSIIRGENQIGGSIIEISTNKTRIIFDVGLNLDSKTDDDLPMIEGLFYGTAKYDAIFISHYHPDHIGLIDKVIKDIPIYVGETASEIINAANSYLQKNPLRVNNFIENEKSVLIGDITVTPYICDHSAFDSFMFIIENGGERILYTGDFRANGRKDFEELLLKLPTVQILIIEGTSLTREEYKNITELELEDRAVKILEKHKGPAFLLASSQNIDRLITVQNVAKRTGRIFAQDIYTAMIARATSNNQLLFENNGNLKVFIHNNSERNYDLLLTFAKNKISRQALSKSNYVMSIRPSLKAYIEKLNELQSFDDGVLFYSMWKGYQEKEYLRDFLKLMQEKGVTIYTLHTSGHADRDTIKRLIDKVKPEKIIPIHTENPQWFKENYSDLKSDDSI